jgi:hypothetical protein
MERSEIRGRSAVLMPLPGFAALNPGYEERKQKKKEGGGTPTDA